MAPIRVLILGTSNRSSYLYAPLLAGMPDRFQLAGVWGRGAEKTKIWAERFGAEGDTNLERLVRNSGAQAAIVSVNYNANGEVGLMAVEAGLHALLETPIAHRLADADLIIRTAERKKLKIEVAEQFHRRPLEQIKLKLIEEGIFGEVYSSFNDFSGHGYHGASVMRSYLGFDRRPLSVTGSAHTYPLAAQRWALNQDPKPRDETQEHGIIEFEGGRIGIFHWTDIGYDSPLRWWRSSRFLAEKGMGISVGIGLDLEERLSLLAPGSASPLFITLERRWERVDGGILDEMVAHTGLSEKPIVRWANPFKPALQGHGPQWHDDEIGVAGCLLSLYNAIVSDGKVTYGPRQARLDQEIILGLRMSAARGGQPVNFPLDPDQQTL